MELCVLLLYDLYNFMFTGFFSLTSLISPSSSALVTNIFVTSAHKHTLPLEC